MDENNYITFEDKLYPNPQLGLDESNAFIENLRNIQAEDTARINKQTYNLGTQVPSNLGGLSGAETTFAERYQVPQTEQMIADLKATAQQNALNQALKNTLAQYKQRYQNAYKNAAKRAQASPYVSTDPTADGDISGDVVVENYPSGVASGEIPGTISSAGAGTTVVPDLSYGKNGEPGYKVYDNNTGEVLYDSSAEAIAAQKEKNKIVQLGSAALGLLGSTPTIYGAAANAVNQLLFNEGWGQSLKR